MKLLHAEMMARDMDFEKVHLIFESLHGIIHYIKLADIARQKNNFEMSTFCMGKYEDHVYWADVLLEAYNLPWTSKQLLGIE